MSTQVIVERSFKHGGRIHRLNSEPTFSDNTAQDFITRKLVRAKDPLFNRPVSGSVSVPGKPRPSVGSSVLSSREVPVSASSKSKPSKSGAKKKVSKKPGA